MNRNVFLLLFLLINCSIPEESKQKDVSLKNDQVGTNDPQPEPTDGPEGMVWIPGGVFIMGALDEDGQAR
ncbi:MAG: hypothetical protein AAF551_13455, partial [Bacteroidota bacterium]